MTHPFIARMDLLLSRAFDDTREPSDSDSCYLLASIYGESFRAWTEGQIVGEVVVDEVVLGEDLNADRIAIRWAIQELTRYLHREGDRRAYITAVETRPGEWVLRQAVPQVEWI